MNSTKRVVYKNCVSILLGITNIRQNFGMDHWQKWIVEVWRVWMWHFAVLRFSRNKNCTLTAHLFGQLLEHVGWFGFEIPPIWRHIPLVLRSPCHLTSDALTQGRSFTMGGDELSGAPGTKQVSLEVHSRAALAYVARGVLFSLGSMPNFEERESWCRSPEAGLWQAYSIDETPVTNAQFREFVKETKYRTGLNHWFVLQLSVPQTLRSW